MNGRKVLVIEDNPLNAKLLRDLLRHHGFEVLEAGSAEDGLPLAVSERPALVLMDIQLPGMDGKQALKRLKADPQTQAIPVIAVTASIMPAERSEVLAAGFDGFQSKPISIVAMLEEIRKVLPDVG